MTSLIWRISNCFLLFYYIFKNFQFQFQLWFQFNSRIGLNVIELILLNFHLLNQWMNEWMKNIIIHEFVIIIIIPIAIPFRFLSLSLNLSLSFIFSLSLSLSFIFSLSLLPFTCFYLWSNWIGSQIQAFVVRAFRSCTSQWTSLFSILYSVFYPLLSVLVFNVLSSFCIPSLSSSK